MFIVTMVFLTGVIFAVQQLLFQYSEIDLSQPMQKTDFYILHNMRDLIQQSLYAPNCGEAANNLEEIVRFLGEQPLRGFTFSLMYNGEFLPNLNCSNWKTAEPVLDLKANIIGPGLDSVVVYPIYGREKEEIVMAAPWWEEFLQPWIDMLKGGNATTEDEGAFFETVVYVFNRTAADVNCSINDSIDDATDEAGDIHEYLSQDLGNYTLKITYFTEEENLEETPIVCDVMDCPIALLVNLTGPESDMLEAHCLPYELKKFKLIGIELKELKGK